MGCDATGVCETVRVRAGQREVCVQPGAHVLGPRGRGDSSFSLERPAQPCGVPLGMSSYPGVRRVPGSWAVVT